MSRGERIRVALHGLEAAYSLLLLAWLALPLLLPWPWLPPSLWGLPARLAGAGSAARLAAAAIVYLILALRLYKLAALFLDRALPGVADPRRTFPILASLASSAAAAAALLLEALPAASSWRYFQALPPALYAVFGLSLAHNALFLALLIARQNRKDASFQEYLEFRRRGRGGGLLTEVLPQGIQKRLGISFTVLVLVIVAVLSYVLMRNFHRTVLAAVIENGQALAERTASVIRANFGDDIAADDYFRIEGQKNERATFRFNRLTFYRRDAQGGGYTAASSSLRSEVGRRLEGEGFGQGQPPHRYLPEAQVYEFRAPVEVSDILIGFAQVDYSREAIYEPYFRAKVKVVLIAVLCLYATVFLVYLIGRGITFPILFLRVSVASIAATLAGMIQGRVRISPDLLQYKDRVRTRDEIKQLSGEIGNMTAVLRGLMPYISASTLRYSERAKPATARRELAFLFTDVRGFAALCENLEAEKVEQLLNRCLDLQSTVILANGGDIDNFIGDGVMAFFEGARRELAACRSAMEIQAAMAREKELARAGGKEALDIGIGIHTGPVVFGSFGAKDRMTLTSIGDTVNLASRLESANKEYGTKSLLSRAVYAKVREHYLCREIDVIFVKGKSQPVQIYEMLQEQRKASDRARELKKVFELGLALYRRQRWADAEKAFGYLVRKHRDEPSAVFLPRIAHFRKVPPPEGWNGVFQLAAK